MNARFDAPMPVTTAVARERRLLYLAYGCFALGLLLLPVLFPLVAVVIAYLERSTAPPELRVHYEWIIRTFWIWLVGLLIGGGLVIVFVGLFILMGIWIWGLYRVVRGLLRLSEGRPPSA